MDEAMALGGCGIAGGVALAAGVPDRVRLALAPYSWLSGCAECWDYTTDYFDHGAGCAVVAATIAFHASSHRLDTLMSASQHFGAGVAGAAAADATELP